MDEELVVEQQLLPGITVGSRRWLHRPVHRHRVTHQLLVQPYNVLDFIRIIKHRQDVLAIPTHTIIEPMALLYPTILDLPGECKLCSVTFSPTHAQHSLRNSVGAHNLSATPHSCTFATCPWTRPKWNTHPLSGGCVPRRIVSRYRSPARPMDSVSATKCASSMNDDVIERTQSKFLSIRSVRASWGGRE